MLIIWSSHREQYSQYDPTPVPERDRDYYAGYNQHEDQSSCNCGETMGEFLKHEDVAEASTSCTSDLMRQGLRVQTGSSAVRVGRSGVRRRGVSRTTSQANNLEGSVTPRARDVGEGEGGSGSRPRTASSSRHASRRPSPSTSRRPSRRSSRDISRDPTGSSRNMTPDRLSIAYQEEDEYFNSGDEDDAAGEGADDDGRDVYESEAWDSEDDEELMDKLERERQKREQLYTTQMARAAQTSASATSSKAATTRQQPPEPPPPWASSSSSSSSGMGTGARQSMARTLSSGLTRPLGALDLNGRGEGSGSGSTDSQAGGSGSGSASCRR